MMRSSSFLVALLAIAACGPTSRDGTNDGGREPDGRGGGGDGGVGGVGDGGDECSDEAKLIYVVDQTNKLAKFDPPTKQFMDLGTLNCPASGAQPFSMAVDRDTIAWVLFSNGELFRVDIENGLACTQAGWQPGTAGHQVFGMGFSTDTPGGVTDTLFIAGGQDPMVPMSKLAKLDMGTYQPTQIGNVTGWPELTGTGNAELWGFFPTASGSHVAKLDKTNGTEVQTFPLASLSGQPTAWAFAFWGGDFWVFLMKGIFETSSTVYQVNGTNGTITSMTVATGRVIVGAGVSTCAPVIIL